jgi:uncharacterized protein (DUF433 family)
VFRGTRIPVAALFQNLEDGVSLAEFVDLFPEAPLKLVLLTTDEDHPTDRLRLG